MGRIEQPNPSLPELRVARRCLRAARPRHQRPRPARELPGRQSFLIPMNRRESYLDWNATAPLRPEAAAAITAALAHCGNPSSVHRWGRRARQMVEGARETIALLIGVDPESVVFVSGGTEANHLALLGSGRRRVLVSAVEHSSVLQAVPDAERIPVDADGIIDLVRFEEELAADPRPALVSFMLANTEAGIVDRVAAIV